MSKTRKPKTFIINGENFSDVSGFYDEIKKVLTRNFENFGNNLDALQDVLRGGFSKFGYNEQIKLVWRNSEKSKKELGKFFNRTVKTIKNSKNIKFKIE